MNPDTIACAIERTVPMPADPFARAKWMGDAALICSGLAKRYQGEEKSLILKIRAENLTSDTYDLAALSRPYAKVNKPLLKVHQPELYAKLVHVRASDAVKVLGCDELYRLMAERLGDAVAAYEVVTVSDVRRFLPAAEAGLYVIDDCEFVKYAVVEKEA